MSRNTRPELGTFVVYACAICNQSGLSSKPFGLVPEGPSIYLCDECTRRLHAHPGDRLLYCMTCRRITHIVKPGDTIPVDPPDDGDRIVFVRDCQTPSPKAYKRNELHGIGFTDGLDGTGGPQSPL